jgi:hypothetical protein
LLLERIGSLLDQIRRWKTNERLNESVGANNLFSNYWCWRPDQSLFLPFSLTIGIDVQKTRPFGKFDVGLSRESWPQPHGCSNGDDGGRGGTKPNR